MAERAHRRRERGAGVRPADPRPRQSHGVASNKKPFEQFKGGTTELRIDLAGAAHYLYIQPLNLGLPDDEKEGSGGWFLGGAASYDNVLRR